MPTIRPIRRDEEPRFLQRIIDTSWHDLPADWRTRFTPAKIAPSIENVVSFLMQQGDNVILIADLPDLPNAGQIWLGQARDAYTGTMRAYIYDLFVEPEARQQGVGQALLEAAEQAASARGDKEVALTVAAHNHTAQTLYRAFGFENERLTLRKSLEE
ncbi:MAG: GNAT family N-acetyltransferase [Ardenticatenaceae bacterium]